MHSIYSYSLRHDAQGRIIKKAETVQGRSNCWTYAYDKKGRLFEAHLDNRLIYQCYYDKQGRRIQDSFPATHGVSTRTFRYTMENRLQAAGNNGYTHDRQGMRLLWNSGGNYTRYEYAPDHRLLRATREWDGTVFEFAHHDNGQRAAKFRDGTLVEAYHWLDFIRLAAFHDGAHEFTFAYRSEERTPHAMRRDDGQVFTLHHDQIGSLRVVADQGGNMIQETLYDPFGGIIESTNPTLRIPLGFAGGLHDRDLGFVRFGWRDYDTYTGRWTAPDPLGDAGGDPDWYGYCLDDPVNGVDPLGLRNSSTVPGVEFDENGIPTGEVGLEPPDFMLDPVMDWIPAIPVGKAIKRTGEAASKAYQAGKEFNIGKDIRIAPFGNRTGHPVGKYPHYHRRGKIDSATGQTKDGQGIGRHRPWEKKGSDSSSKDRF